jgi:MoaA/NifB/PqqE/SkfB family radical SAM enzyme
MIGRRALGLGFTSTIGIIHDGSGQLKPLGAHERRVWSEMRSWRKKNYSRFNHFQEKIANGEPNDWRCRAGSRFLYICENGLVHYCSQQRGYPGVPLAEYTKADLKREFLTEKGCAPNCTVSCVHQISFIDYWRAPQRPTPPPTANAEGLVNIRL